MEKDELIRRSHERIRQLVLETLDKMPFEEKRQRCLVPFTAKVPECRQEQVNHIEHMLNPFAPGDYTDDELRDQLLTVIHDTALDIDESLPTLTLQAELRNALMSMSPEELLEAGVFGRTWTEEDVENVRSMNEKQIYLEMMRRN